MKIQRITAGNLFNFAIDEKGQVYYWGCGEYGAAGDASTKNCSVPETINYFEYLSE
jgi:alpha-tubulin suppressor-like RCC1 family protein